MRALVVDDDPTIRSFVTAILLAEGFEILAAEDGDDALEMVRESDGVDVMITDIQMPRRDGVSLARAVAEEFPTAAIVLMSGYPAPDADFDFIQKPFSWIEMRSKVRRACRRPGCLPPAA
jgi:DNA-binding response OmpR family regulator